MTDFPILLYNSTSETPTLSFTSSLIQAEPPRIGHYGETPPGYSNKPENFCFAKCCGITCNFQDIRVDCAILDMTRIAERRFLTGLPRGYFF